MSASSIDLPSTALLAMSRDALLALRAAMFRELGTDAAALWQDAGFAGGQALYDAFSSWLSASGAPAVDVLTAAEFSVRATEFFRETGWGSIEMGSMDAVATLDSSDWAESDPNVPLEFPGCYYSAGVLADFFGRLAGEPLAVMEVECRSMGDERCRFLVGSGETMQAVYDAMASGWSYQDAIAGQS